MDIAIVIPARFDSSRFPGKPLVEILGTSMIERVWKQCIKVLPIKNVFVATDSEKIANHCKMKGIQFIMTSSSCLTGTDRVYEASKKIKAKIIVNVQGDEPLILPEDIQLIIKEAKKNPKLIINAMCPIIDESEFRKISVPKVVCRKDGMLFYISRAPIPLDKNNGHEKSWKQVCIYAFPIKALENFAKNGNKTPIESIEDIEIIRFLELGFQVKMIRVSQSSIAVDYPDDILRVEKAILEKSN